MSLSATYSSYKKRDPLVLYTINININKNYFFFQQQWYMQKFFSVFLQQQVSDSNHNLDSETKRYKI